MRPEAATDGWQHPTDGAADDHHLPPKQVAIFKFGPSMPTGTDFDLDIALGDSAYQWGRVKLIGLHALTSTIIWREWASVHFTRILAEAIGHTGRDSGTVNKSYSATYSKQNGALNLTQKIFDNTIGAGNKYIALKDAVLTGSVLRLTFHNYDASSRTLFVRGLTQVY